MEIAYGDWLKLAVDVIPALGGLIVMIFGFGIAKQRLDDIASWRETVNAKAEATDKALEALPKLDEKIANVDASLAKLDRRVEQINDLAVQLGRVDERTSALTTQVSGMSNRLDLVLDHITSRPTNRS